MTSEELKETRHGIGPCLAASIRALGGNPPSQVTSWGPMVKDGMLRRSGLSIKRTGDLTDGLVGLEWWQTVREFIADHPSGKYLIGSCVPERGHAIAIADGVVICDLVKGMCLDDDLTFWWEIA